MGVCVEKPRCNDRNMVVRIWLSEGWAVSYSLSRPVETRE
jgi:hypothetical protein